MIEQYISIAMHVLIVLFSIVLYIFTVSHIFPRIFLKPVYDKSFEGDRGLQRYTFPNGRAVVYIPSVSIKKYVNQYILSCNKGDKYIKCSIDKRIHSIKYNVIAFDANDNLIDTVCVDEPSIRILGVTNAVLLPVKTAYVSLEINEVNGGSVRHGARFGLPLSRIGIFVFVTTLCTVVENICLNSLVLRAVSLFMSNSNLSADKLKLLALVVGLGVGLFISVLIWLLHQPRHTKLLKK